MKHNIHYSAAPLQDLDDIWGYVGRELLNVSAGERLLDRLIANGQVATQYVDLKGQPSMDIAANPNGSVCAIEGIFSPDRRVFGKMGHSERRGPHLAKNIPGDKFQPIFESGAAYFA